MTSTDNLQGFTGEEVREPGYPQYTNLRLGDGVFDQLMAASEEHINKQFDENRITGNEYSQLYLGNLQAVLNNSTQYLLGIMLLPEQRAKMTAETSLVAIQEEKVEIEKGLLELEKEKLKYQIEQLFPLEKQKLELEVEKVRQEGLLIEAQIRKIDAEILHMLEQQELWDKQEDKIVAEIAYLAAQEAMMLKQAEKIDKEIEFLGWKIETEQANTVAGVAQKDSLIGRQMSLLTAQKYGFAGDIEAKMAKLHADFQGVYESIHEPGIVSVLGTDAKGAIGRAVGIASDIQGA
jgi:hypothetical protein